MDIINKPVDFIKNYFSKLSEDKLMDVLSDGTASSQTSTQNAQSSDFSAILEKELGIEGSLDLRMASIPRLNDCKTPAEITALHHKLVRFDCMI